MRCIRISTVKRRKVQLNLLGTRQQNHSVETALPVLQRVREQFPKAGLRDMKLHAFQNEEEKISRFVTLFINT
jgi:hypothetical protein